MASSLHDVHKKQAQERLDETLLRTIEKAHAAFSSW
jgi:hypothetical protein